MLINAGQANAATGDAGYQDCLKSAEAVAQALGIDTDQVLIESTGTGLDNYFCKKLGFMCESSLDSASQSMLLPIE